MSKFAQAWAKAAPNVDTFFGEPFIFHPMAQVGGKWIADSGRAVAAITAALDEAAVLSDPLGKRVAANTASQHATTHAMIDIASDALLYAPKAKDRLARVSDGVIYEVSAVLQDNFARIGLRVVKLGAPA